MVNNESFLQFLLDNGISFFTGVPDSLLKEICACITDKLPGSSHVIASNEGAAVALASGYHLATSGIPLVYLQNSGLGNTINPLLSLADPKVYSIPMILMIGWRGEPGVHDEPQHVKQGEIQNKMLDVMEIPYTIIGPDSDYKTNLTNVITLAKEGNRPCALIVKKGTFDKYESQPSNSEESLLSREDVLQLILNQLSEKDIIVSTTGMASREIFEIRANKNQGHHRDFLTVGSMGHCSQIALGLAKHVEDQDVYCIDGDGSLIMHMGSLPIIGSQCPEKFKHIVINNGAHDSVGGQPTVGLNINITQVALACSYKGAKRAINYDEINNYIKWLKQTEGPVMLEILVKKGNRKDLGRPTKSPLQNKNDFMKYIMHSDENLS